MKTFVFLILSLTAGSRAWAGWDGCYQLVNTGVMYPALCFQGTEEEGINGSNVRLFVFRTNTNTLDTCAVGRITKLSRTDLIFEKNGIKEVVFANFDGKMATALIDGFPAPVKAVRLAPEFAQRLWKNADTRLCK